MEPKKDFIINFMVYSNGEDMFLDSVDASGKENEHQYAMQLLEVKIRQLVNIGLYRLSLECKHLQKCVSRA